MKEKKMSPQPNELAMQNVIRKRYCKDWPNTILQLTKRVQGVNETWSSIVMMLMTIPGLSIIWKHDAEKDALVVSIAIKHPDTGGVPVEEVEIHEINAHELMEASKYVEVLFMDKVRGSKLIARWLEDEAKHIAERKLP
ncbi:hypothetical protein KAR91_20350 [Candidatus Pacearchaeota archaeon]|nr:hypothetical protein [Candidatus Pacearchaeota archaeon]